MFDEWLRLFWKTVLWWLPGGDDDGTTAHGKAGQQAQQRQDTTSRETTSTPKTESTSQTGATPAGGKTAKAGADQAAAAGSPETGTGTAQAKSGGTSSGKTGTAASGTGGAAQTKKGGKAGGQGNAQAKASGPGASDGDDLTAIKGIGPTLSQRLHALGIKTYADLVKADPADLAAKVNQRTVTAKKVQDWIADAKSRMG